MESIDIKSSPEYRMGWRDGYFEGINRMYKQLEDLIKNQTQGRIVIDAKNIDPEFLKSLLHKE